MQLVEAGGIELERPGAGRYLHWEIAEGNLHSLLFVGNLGVRTTYEYWRSRKQKISMEEFDNY